MPSSQSFETKTAYVSQDPKKRWIGLALAFSLVLHIGAAVVIIIACGLGTNGKIATNLVIQNVELTPSFRAPEESAPAPADLPPEKASPPATTTQEPVTTAQEHPPEQLSDTAQGTGKKNEIMSTPLGLGMTHGYFSGLADGRTLRDDIRVYYFEMVEKINRQWWEKAGLLKEPLRQDGIFELLVQRDGTIVSVRILQGSGSSEADRLLSEIVKNASPLPPLPATYEQSMFRAPLRIKAPSFLFRL